MSEEAALEQGVDKTGWPDGPWMTEPDRLQWQHAGYACLIVRDVRMGHLYGYVGVDSAHPYYGKGFDVPDVEVHGGLTYSGKCQDPICPVPGMPDDVWWFGFDAAHLLDLSPGLVFAEKEFANSFPALAGKLARMAERHLIGATYRDLPYMKAQTEHLAEQLRALAV